MLDIDSEKGLIMKKILLFILSIMIAAGCKISSVERTPLNAEELWHYAKSLQNTAVREIPENFITLMGIDEFESLSDEEKKKPVYDSYRQYTTHSDGFRYYKNYGHIRVDSKRLMENGSIWVARPYVFTCSGSVSEGFEWALAMENGYNNFSYDEDATRLWVEDDTIFFEFSAREKSQNGYTAVIKSKTPMNYSISKKTYSLSYRVEIFDKDGSLAEWIEVNETELYENYTTSRDS